MRVGADEPISLGLHTEIDLDLLGRGYWTKALIDAVHRFPLFHGGELISNLRPEVGKGDGIIGNWACELHPERDLANRRSVKRNRIAQGDILGLIRHRSQRL